MNQSNLIPSPIKERRRVHRRGALWAKSIGVFTGLGVAGIATAGILLGDMDSPVRNELQTIKSVINQLEASEAAYWARIAVVTNELGVAEDITGQPDWSVLLGVLAAGLAEGAYLERVNTQVMLPEGVRVSPPSNAAAGPYRITLTGVSLRQGDATRYALFLEDCRLFDSVRMIGTSPRSDIEEGAIGFEFECMIGNTQEASHGP